MRIRAAVSAILGEWARRQELSISSAHLMTLMNVLGYKDATVRTAVYRMRHEGILVTERKDGRTLYCLTEQGRKWVEAATRRIFETARGNWDGSWRVLTYNVPEPQRKFRDELRKELRWLGFGQLTVSTWISPCDVLDYAVDLCRTHQMQSYVQIFVGRHAGMVSDHELVQQAWDLNAVDRRYQEFIHRVHHRWRRLMQRPHKLTDAVAFAERVHLVTEFQAFLDIDPWLPVELLPKNWAGEEARRLFWAFYLDLSPRAERLIASAAVEAGSVKATGD